MRPDLYLSVAGECVIVFGGIDNIAPAVEDDEFVGPIFVRILWVDIGVEILNSEHIVDLVPVGGDDVGEPEVLFHSHEVGDLAGTSRWRGEGVVICFGTIFSLPLVVTVLPVAYWQIFKNNKK